MLVDCYLLTELMAFSVSSVFASPFAVLQLFSKLFEYEIVGFYRSTTSSTFLMVASKEENLFSVFLDLAAPEHYLHSITLSTLLFR